ncbi:hypothetical protein NW762_013818 [Fusarium torreyae]|uniref:F-box domain-containing protein n=1 Tax=Fusarium torreyae TaxID=1237075 RepID=A0A9W8V780_9HYPO|nr:hypothetical protein NW762_013818 [Fusarium torreyae]
MAIIIPIIEHHSPGSLLLPPEVWDHICSFLPRLSLFRLRLVCSRLNEITLPWAYRELRLEGFGDSEQRFIEVAKSPTLRHLVRELTVDTLVDHEFAYNCNEDYPTPTAFLDALPYISYFGRLETLHLRFNQYCGEDERTGKSIEETWCFRYRVLDTVCHCIAGMWNIDKQMEIEEKAEDVYDSYERTYPDSEDESGVPFGQVIQLKELTVANLADYNDADLAKSKGFQKVMSLPSLTSLKVFVTSEIDEDSDDSIAYYKEKYEFFERLPETWLAPNITDNLSVLSLYYQDYWGWFPKMDFRGIEFPQLKVLAFGHYVLSHEWQIDWISSLGKKNGSGGLRELYLDDCPILFKACQASPLDGADPGYPVLGTVLGQYNIEDHDYPMRWHDVLSKWATSMKELRAFRMGHGQWRDTPPETLESVRIGTTEDVDEEVLEYRLSNNAHRYFNCPEPLDQAYLDEDRREAWTSGRYLHGTGIDGSGGYKFQYIEYDIQVVPSPWQETFWNHVLDEEGYEPEEGTWARDNAALEDFYLVINSRVASDNKSAKE